VSTYYEGGGGGGVTEHHLMMSMTLGRSEKCLSK